MQEVLNGQFEIEQFDPDGQLYTKVRKVILKSKNYKLYLDYNCILLNLKENDIVDLVIYKGEAVEELIPVEYNYVCQGMCYKQTNSKTFISFGGLLLEIEGYIDICDSDEVCLAVKVI